MSRFERPSADSKRIAKNTLVLFIRMIAVMFVGLFTSRVQLDALGVSDYGLYQVAMATISILCFMNGPMSMSSSRFLTVEMGRGSIGTLKRMFSTILIVHVILAIIVVLLLETVGLYLLGSRLNINPTRLAAVRWAYQCGVFTTFLGITQVPYNAMIIAHERMSAFANMSFYDVGSKLAIAYALYCSPVDKLITYSTLLALSSVTTIAIYRIYCTRNFTEARFRRVFNFSLIRPVFSFTGWQLISQLVISLITQGMVMVNQRYFGPIVVASIAVATTVKGCAESLMNSFRAAANPQIVKLFAAREKKQCKALLIESVLFSLILFSSLAIPVGIYASDLLKFWLGANVPELAPQILRIILVGAIGTLFDWAFFVIISADGRIGPNTVCDSIVYGVGFSLAFVLVYYFRNPLTSSCVLAAACWIQGFMEKPLLLYFQIGYKPRDFISLFGKSAIAIALSLGGALLMSAILPSGTPLCIVSSGVIAAVSAFILISVLATPGMCEMISRLTSRFGIVGYKCSQVIKAYFSFLLKIKRCIRFN